MTREDIAIILLKAKKAKSFVYINTRPRYLEEMARNPYLVNYTPSIFHKYDGMDRNAREHIKRYVDALTAYSHYHELRLKEFSKSLKVKLLLGIVAFH